jgi:selenocysteine lyase/cysteine desulfurase
MFAPACCGILYGRGEMLDRLWPAVVSGGWDNKKDLRAARFMMVGTNNRSIFHGMIAGLRFLKELGPANVFARQKQLSRRIIDRVRRRRYVEHIQIQKPTVFRGFCIRKGSWVEPGQK